MRNGKGSSSGLVLLVALLCQLLAAGEGMSQTQLKNRDWLNLGSPEPYLNYGRKEFDPYPNVITARNKYDRLGNFQMRGYKVFEWNVSRPGLSEITTRRVQYLGWFSNLVILSDSYRGWKYAATLGEDIRTKLTDLTLNDPRWYGLRLDGASSDNQFTLLLNQGGAQQTVPKFSTFQSTTEQSPVLGFGGHWETRVGSILRLGATYFNQHMADTFNENGSFLKGDTPYSMLPPKAITVIVEDDSPETPGTPAWVYNIGIVVTGERQGLPVRLTSIKGDPDYDPTLNPSIQGGAVAGDARQVAGSDDRVLYEFALPFQAPPDSTYARDPTSSVGLTIHSIRFRADVAGDYRIAVRQKYLMFDEAVYKNNVAKNYTPGDGKYVTPYVDRQWPVKPDLAISQVNPFMQYKWNLQNPEDVGYTVVRSTGQGLEGSNRRTVEFDYGIPTGQALYGLNGVLELKGFTLKGEVSSNPQYFIYPVGRDAGDRTSKRTWAYFVNGMREWGSVKLGGELFRLDPDYSGNYDSVRGGIPFFSDRTASGSQMQEMYVMNDNDDNDQWPDEFTNELPSTEKADSGVYPGLDENQDLIPDSDQNVNGIPDWTEPIIFFDADPPDFVYGVDFNNNGVVDFRENDNEPDYPYRRDRRGTHLFAIKDGLGRFGSWVSAGTYRMKATAGGNKASAVYGRYEYRFLSPYLGRLQVNEDIKWVKDGIPDDVYIWRDRSSRRVPSPVPYLTGKEIEERDLNSQILPPTPDPLLMRNSLVNTLFAESRLTLVQDIQVTNNIQWIRNSQKQDEFADSTQQADDVRSVITMVNKASYTLQAGNLNVRPMFKHLLIRESSSELDRATADGRIQSYSIYSPVLRAKYRLTDKSTAEMGFQGFPFWKYNFADRRDRINNYEEWTVLTMMTNHSDYYGYNLASQFGWMKTRRSYDDPSKAALNMDNTKLFFDIVAGF
jgi:hypothetical protein